MDIGKSDKVYVESVKNTRFEPTDYPAATAFSYICAKCLTASGVTEINTEIREFIFSMMDFYSEKYPNNLKIGEKLDCLDRAIEIDQLIDGNEEKLYQTVKNCAAIIGSRLDIHDQHNATKKLKADLENFEIGPVHSIVSDEIGITFGGTNIDEVSVHRSEIEPENDESESDESKSKNYRRYLGYFFYPARVLGPLLGKVLYPVAYISFFVPFGIMENYKKTSKKRQNLVHTVVPTWRTFLYL
ncbi:hypothetical protein GGP77_001147 [Salinibacter ruber]|uniref:hypothetical protein n=1 Tax=Salinibacter ruber TaxID=146919 RepID=UPI00216A9D42|nr:hypothetical protein [Salinibacter ruber]MCS3666924.1 hypothetical protein [Salinibacter ruber]